MGKITWQTSLKKKKSMCREFNAKMIVWCLTKTRFPSRPCFVYGLWNVPLGKTWSLFVCLVRRTCKKKKKKKKTEGSGYCANPWGPVASFKGLCKMAAAPCLLAALQAASRWEKSAPFSCLHSQAPPTALSSGSKPPTVKQKFTCLPDIPSSWPTTYILGDPLRLNTGAMQ